MSKNNYIFLGLLFIVALTCIVYYPSLHYAFQFDDGPNIIKLFDVRNLKFTDLCLSSTRWISYWLNTILYQISQFDPFYYRIANLFFHIFTGILIFLFTYLCLRHLRDISTKIAFLVTALFLLHPVQTQTISYIIQGQLEGLSSLFIMSLLLCSIFIFDNKSYLKYFLVTLFSLLTILSTGSKEIIIATPFLILLTDWFFVSQANWQKIKTHLWLPILNFVLIISSYVYIKPWFLLRMLNLNYVCNNNPGNIITQNAQEAITIGPFCVSQFKVLLHYLWIYIWPFNISVEYDFKLIQLSSFDFVFPFIIILTIWGLIIYLLKHNKTSLIAFGLLWFFIVNAPRASIIPCSELVADYKTYLASFGWLLVIAILIIKLLEKYFYIILILISLSLGYLTYQRNKVWRSGIEFWGNIIQNAPSKARAYNNYAVELSNAGKFKESVIYFKKAIRLEGSTYYDPYTNLAGAYAVLGDTDLAIETLNKSLKINNMQPEAYNNLGAFYLHKQDLQKAHECFKTALDLKPHYGKAMYNLGKLYLVNSDWEQAHKIFKQACTASDIDCDLPPWVGFAEISMNLKKYDDVKFACENIIRIAPHSQEAKIAKGVLENL
ncbi:MAG: tetratricopeptide repeat protein [Candidatus Babeliales bacterium]|nr:tetratricopeptide repeat protein [Candidatus Babeliales bacterium]